MEDKTGPTPAEQFSPKRCGHPSLIDPQHFVLGFRGKNSTQVMHKFEVHQVNRPEPLETVQFQDGSADEERIDGVHNEDLLLMVLARLQGFQETGNRCRENAIAITKIEEALMWLSRRTQERRGRGVEGTTKP